MYVCVCNAVTETEIRQAVELGARSLHDLRCGLGVASSCGRCESCAHAFLPAVESHQNHKQMACEQPSDNMRAVQAT